jgi:hypothetical protein
MYIHNAFTKPFRMAAVVALLAASTSLVAGSTIRITNTSSQPWCLRISEEPSAPLIAHGGAPGAPCTAVELSPSHKLVYFIQPGETCTLQFKNPGELPVKKDVGLVDKAGVEKGILRLESRSAQPHQTLGVCSEDCIQTSVLPLTDVPNVVTQNGADAVTINAACWQ